MNSKKSLIFFNTKKKELIKKFLIKENNSKSIYIYSCILSIKYKGIIGYTKKKSTISSNIEIKSVNDRQVLIDKFLKNNLEVEDAKILQLIKVEEININLDYKKELFI